KRASGTASLPETRARSPGATGTTPSRGRLAVRPSCLIWPYCAGRITAWFTKKVGSSSERKSVTGRRSLPSTGFRPTPAQPDRFAHRVFVLTLSHQRDGTLGENMAGVDGSLAL